MQYKCKKCGRSFHKKYDYDNHKKRKTSCITKSGSKTAKKTNFKCVHCKKDFSRKDSLSRHIATCKSYKKIQQKTTGHKSPNVKGNKNKIDYSIHDDHSIHDNTFNNTYVLNVIVDFDKSLEKRLKSEK